VQKQNLRIEKIQFNTKLKKKNQIGMKESSFDLGNAPWKLNTGKCERNNEIRKYQESFNEGKTVIERVIFTTIALRKLTIY